MRQISPDDLSGELERNYEYYQQRLLRRLLKLVQGKEHAEDICHDTFERALNQFKRQSAKLPQNDNQLENWLRVVAEHIAIDNYRRTRKFVSQPIPDDEAGTQLTELMMEGVEGRIDLIWLQEVWPQLSSKQRDSLMMQLRGFSEKEIAAQLNISPSAVSMHLSRGRAELRRKVYPVMVDMQDVKIPYLVQECERMYRGFDTPPLHTPWNEKEKQLQQWYQDKISRPKIRNIVGHFA